MRTRAEYNRDAAAVFIHSLEIGHDDMKRLTRNGEGTLARLRNGAPRGGLFEIPTVDRQTADDPQCNRTGQLNRPPRGLRFLFA